MHPLARTGALSHCHVFDLADLNSSLELFFFVLPQHAAQELVDKYIGHRQSCKEASAAVEMRPANSLCHDPWQTDIQKSAADHNPI